MRNLHKFLKKAASLLGTFSQPLSLVANATKRRITRDEKKFFFNVFFVLLVFYLYSLRLFSFKCILLHASIKVLDFLKCE